MKLKMLYALLAGICALGCAFSLSAQSASPTPEYIFFRTPGEATIGSTLGTINFKGLNNKNEVVNGAMIRTIVNRSAQRIIPTSFEFLTGVDELKSRLFIGETGWMGINTNNPNALLTIDQFSNGDQTPLLFSVIGGQKSNPRSFQLLSNGNQINASLAGNLLVNNNGNVILTNGSLRVLQGNASIESGDVYVNVGKIGIGIDPNEIESRHSFGVKGGIKCNLLEIANVRDWPDFVFEASYPLMEIDDLKKYITKNKHLPDLPSAAAMEQQALNIAEMIALLLKKIEELTLYIIQQNEEISLLQKKIEKR